MLSEENKRSFKCKYGQNVTINLTACDNFMTINSFVNLSILSTNGFYPSGTKNLARPLIITTYPLHPVAMVTMIYPS